MSGPLREDFFLTHTVHLSYFEKIRGMGQTGCNT